MILCDAPDLLGASWGDDGSIIAAITRGRLWRVSSSGGSPTVLLDLAAESDAPVWPQFLPGPTGYCSLRTVRREQMRPLSKCSR